MLSNISAAEYNSALRRLATIYPITAKIPENGLPRHTWMVDTNYDEKKRRWYATLRPGSVNGKIATIESIFGDLDATAQKYLKATRLNTYFTETTRVDVPMDFNPRMALNFREIGGDATPLSTEQIGGEIRQTYEAVPRYFINQGVRPAGSRSAITPETRRLFASDLVLRQPRSSLGNEVTVLPGGPFGGTFVSVNATQTTPINAYGPAKVVSLSKFVTRQTELTFSDIFFNRFQDEPVDELHLSTVYALSQPIQTADFQFIDETFDLMTRYYCHYNLVHATRALPRAETKPVTLITGLGAGLGDFLFNTILAQHNDFVQSTLDMFGDRSLRGAFWAI